MPKKTPGGRAIIRAAKQYRKEELARSKKNRERRAQAAKQ